MNQYKLTARCVLPSAWWYIFINILIMQPSFESKCKLTLKQDIYESKHIVCITTFISVSLCMRARARVDMRMCNARASVCARL